MTVINSIGDLRDMARRRIPRAIFEYGDRGSYDELTIRANRAALDRILLRQRVMIDVSGRSTASTMLGRAVAMPVAIAPTGLTGIMHPDGEIHAARAAAGAAAAAKLAASGESSARAGPPKAQGRLPNAQAKRTDFLPHWREAARGDPMAVHRRGKARRPARSRRGGAESLR